MDIESLRHKIDQLNHQIIQNLKERQELVLQVARYKQSQNLPVFDAQREVEMVAELRTYAKNLGLDPELTGAIFNLILAYSKRDMSFESN